MSDALVVFPEDNAAASHRTDLSGWVSASGRFYGEGEEAERLARWDGSTHRHCVDCRGVVRKNSYCRACEDGKRDAKFEAREVKKWDGQAPLATQWGETYFFAWEDVLSHCDSCDCEPSSLKLVICEPKYAHPVDYDEMYRDLLPEDETLADVSLGLSKAFDELNELIKRKNYILSWSPSEYAADVSAYIGVI